MLSTITVRTFLRSELNWKKHFQFSVEAATTLKATGPYCAVRRACLSNRSRTLQDHICLLGAEMVI